MKTETKALIIVSVMLLSVGPMMFFFGQNQLSLPPKPDTPTYNTYSGNFSAPLMRLEPYISYYGISYENNKTFADSILGGIAENYTLDVSLNPQGYGYQYTIRVYENDTSRFREIGFKLAYNFADFFAKQQGNVPLVVGSVMLLRDFSLALQGDVTKAIHLEYNQSLRVPLIYSRVLHMDVELQCPEIVTSLNDTLVRIPQTCIDTEIPKEQAYMGLTQEDINSAETYFEEGQVKVKKIIEYRNGGTYPDSLEPNDFDGYIKQFGVMRYFINPLIHTYSIVLNDTGQQSIDRIHNFCRSLNLTVETEYLQAVTDAPEKIIVKGETYGLTRIKELPLQVKLETKENSTIQANSTYKLIYGEVIDASAKEKGVLGDN